MDAKLRQNMEPVGIPAAAINKINTDRDRRGMKN